MLRKLLSGTMVAALTLVFVAGSSGIASAAALTVVDTKLISASPSGEPSENVAKGSYGPVISSNGRYVAFSSQSSNIIPGLTPENRQVFVYDRLFRTMEVASRTSATDTLADGAAMAAGISDNGRYVVFNSTADNLAAEHGDSGGMDRVYIRDRQAGSTTLASTTEYGGYAQPHSVSRDGNIIAYGAVTHWGSGGSDVTTFGSYVYNRTTHATTTLPGGPQPPAYNSDYASPTVSGNGRYVTYVIVGEPTVEGLYGQATNYRYDLTTGTSLEFETGANTGAVLSADGNHTAYFRMEAPTTAPYTDEVDLYVQNLTTSSKQLLVDDANNNGVGAANPSLSLSDNGNRVSYISAPSGSPELHVRDIAASQDTVITSNPSIGNATLTADGLQLAYDGYLDAPNSRFQAFVAQFAADAPIVSLSGPIANTTVSGTVALNSQVISSLNYSHIFYVFNSSNQIVASHYQYNVPASTGTLTYNWNTTGLPNGTYKVYSSAKDSANHKEAYSTDYYYVTVNN